METNDFHKHDNIDRDVIEISKGTLLLKLKSCAEYATIPAEILGYGGIALTLLGAAFLTESFHNIWYIPGETVRAAFLFGGIAASIKTAYQFVLWLKNKEDNSPEAIINSLIPLPFKPVALLNAPTNLEETPKKIRKSFPNTANQTSRKL